MAMQGSGISGVDIASVEIRLNDDGFYTLLVGCTDMGTGCDTILAQMAADCLDCSMEEIAVRGWIPINPPTIPVPTPPPPPTSPGWRW